MRIKAKIVRKEPEIIDIPIYTDSIKLDQFLKFAGIAETGGQAKQMIKKNLVKINGETCTFSCNLTPFSHHIQIGNQTYRVTKETPDE